MATSESDKLKLKRFQKNMFRVGKVVSIAERIDHAEHFEAVRTARALAIAGLPKRRCQTRDLSRTLRVGANLWLRVTYTAQEGHDLPFGRQVCARRDSTPGARARLPYRSFARVGSLLKTFGLSEDGRTVSLLRQRFARLAGLSVRLLFGRSEDELEEHVNAEQIFIIR